MGFFICLIGVWGLLTQTGGSFLGVFLGLMFLVLLGTR
jgi:hypothetical protein